MVYRKGAQGKQETNKEKSRKRRAFLGFGVFCGDTDTWNGGMDGNFGGKLFGDGMEKGVFGGLDRRVDGRRNHGDCKFVGLGWPRMVEAHSKAPSQRARNSEEFLGT